MAKKTTFAPPSTVRRNAERGLELKDKFQRGGGGSSTIKAKELSTFDEVSIEMIGKMVEFFNTTQPDKTATGWGSSSNPSAAYITWLLWGGDAGKRWANSTYERERGTQTRRRA